MPTKTTALLLLTALCLFSCRSLPQREAAISQIQAAENTLQTAQKLETPVYVPETYLEARLMLRKARAKMNAEKYSKSRELAQRAQEIGTQALQQTGDERLRVKTLAERLLYRGEEIWDSYAQSFEKEYAADALIEIKRLLDETRQRLETGHYMEALKAVQKSHQKLAYLPEAVEQGRISILEEEKKRLAGQKTAEEIIAAAQKQAEEIIADARSKSRQLLLETKVTAAKTRLEEFERMFPSTYRVKRGETLNDIARRHEIFNDQFMWPLIYKANRDQIRDPKVVFPGQMLSIPRDITREDIIEARKMAEASPPYEPPSTAYNPELYQRYIQILPEIPEEPPTEAPAPAPAQ